MQPGETLWSIAAANNLTTRTVAAYNGLSEDAQVVLGSTVRVPTAVEGYAALQNAGLVAAEPAAAPAAAPRLRPPRPRRPPAPGRLHRAAGRHALRPRRGAGVSLADMAAMNGLDPSGILVAGTVIKLPSGAPAPARSAEPAPAPVIVAADPAPTPGQVGAGDIHAVASEYGVSPSLAAAIAWQESGFNNAMVSARQRARRHAGDAGHVGLRPAEPRPAPARPELADRQRPRRRHVPQAAARRRPAATRTPRSRATTRGSARCSTAACSTTRSSTWTTSRHCVRASAASHSRRRAAPVATAGGAPRAAPPRHAVQRASTADTKFAHGAGAIPTFTP